MSVIRTRLLCALKRFKEALLIADEATDLLRTDVQIALERGHILEAQEDKTGAVAAFEDVVHRFPGSSEPQIALSLLLASVGRSADDRAYSIGSQLLPDSDNPYWPKAWPGMSRESWDRLSKLWLEVVPQNLHDREHADLRQSEEKLRDNK